MDRFLKSNDYRSGFPKRSELENISKDDVQGWLQPMLENGYLEVGVVGDFNEQEVIRVASKTIGALPTRSSQKIALIIIEKLNFRVWDKRRSLVFNPKYQRLW